MKKVFFSVAAIALLACMSSCKKDYTCSCTGGSAGSRTYDLQDLSKSDAETACDAYASGGIVHTSCSL